MRELSIFAGITARLLRRGLLACFLGISLSAGSASVSAASNLPDLGDPSAGVFSPVDEIRLGRQFMRQLRSRLPIVEDPELQDFIDSLKRRLANASGANPDELTFFLIDDTTLNAFAAPGGYIGVHTGLILSAETESELAAVLAHELAHVSQHHLARLISRSKDLSGPAMAAMIAAILVGGQAGAAALVATNAAVVADNLQYSRDFEREADSIGIRTLAAAGFDPAGMTRFFGRMERWARVQEIDVPEFLRTHPLTINRIAEAESRVKDYPVATVAVSDAYQFARARVRALYSTRIDQTVAEFKANLAEGQFENEASERYGYALALARAASTAQAMAEMNKLQAAFPNERRYVLAGSDIELETNNARGAITTLRAAAARWPDDILVQEKLGAALLKSGSVTESSQILEPLSRIATIHPRVLKLYARASAESGQPLAAHRAMAEYHYRRDELDAAIAQLYSARPLTDGNYYEAARIEARIRELNQEKTRFGEP